jgi:hypothetical protein
MGYLEESPIKKSKWLKEEIKSHRYFSDEQWNKIKEKASPELLDFIEFFTIRERGPQTRGLPNGNNYYQINFGSMLKPQRRIRIGLCRFL